jgi:hypothetical protein
MVKSAKLLVMMAGAARTAFGVLSTYFYSEFVQICKEFPDF